ncbi:MAG: 3-deoxy-7-phosphoheptulonate synthase [Deltaproteobacteria bacterium]|nr:3-deoxy-7-phosphoheptulonate synthase [Deltaproteobacteria bacterium]
MSTRTHDINIRSFEPLVDPSTLKRELPMTPASERTVIEGRRQIADILARRDPRLLVIVGPCSIHDERAAVEYAGRLARLQEEVADTMLLVMRVYFEKPRTTVGWKGLINDPHLNGSCDMNTGLRRARRLLLTITGMGLPTATEMLDPITPQYLAGLVCWSAIGARTTESQTHREMASGLSMPVGFKNCTDGGLSTAIHAMVAARTPQSFIGVDPAGRCCIVSTTGNPWTHIVLRGGRRPNYDSVSIEEACHELRQAGLEETIVVDCSHGNSRKKHTGQETVLKNVVGQRLEGNRALVGLMLESNLYEGNQPCRQDPAALAYGVSITDECISWETTVKLLRCTHDRLRESIRQLRAAV